MDQIARAANMEWQPIETAPKDNTRILLWDGQIASTGSWYHDEWAGDDYEAIDATHWMPLPDPPEAD